MTSTGHVHNAAILRFGPTAARRRRAAAIAACAWERGRSGDPLRDHLVLGRREAPIGIVLYQLELRCVDLLCEGPVLEKAALSAGGTASTTITLTPSGGFTGTIALSCSGLPAHSTCTFSPASLTASGTSPVSSTLTIATNTATAALERRGVSSVALAFLSAGGILGMLLLRRRRRFVLPVGLLSLLLVVCGIVGCAGSGSNANVTPKGTYSVVITATSGSTTHTSTYSLTVQ